MRIAIIGAGYVGLVTGACFSKFGNDVVCVDIDATKIAGLNDGVLPIYEPGLDLLVEESYKKELLKFSTDFNATIRNAEIVFIAVGTPMGEDGSADLQYVYAVAEQIGECLENDLVVVDKSTVPVGTADQVQEIIAK